MITLAIETLLRAMSIFGPIIILKQALNGFRMGLDIHTQFLYILVILIGVPAIFIVTNLTANALKIRSTKQQQ